MSTLTNRRCIVFGADGYLGRHLVHYLLMAGNSVAAFGIAGQSPIAGIDYRVADIAQSQTLDAIDWNVDCVFMFAGLTGTYDGFERADEFVTVNEIGLLNILNRIRDSGFRPRIVFPSTRLVYRGSDSALREDDATDPKTIYAINKLACEHILKAYNNSFGIDHTVYRICVPYGNIIGNDYSYGTVGAFLTQAKKNAVIRLYGDGSLRRTFTHVDDLCRQILLTCTSHNAQNQVLNTMGEDVSLVQLAEMIAEKYHAKVEFAAWPEKDLKIESGHTVFDASRLQGICQVPMTHRIAEWLAGIDIMRPAL